MSFHETAENPYIFTVSESTMSATGHTFEEEVRREQRQTVFHADPFLQRLFKGNFEWYHKALEHPAQFFMDMKRESLSSSSTTPSLAPFHATPWDHRISQFRADEIEEIINEFMEDESEDDEEEDVHDALFHEADEWAVALHRWSHTLYYHRHIRSRDLFRIHENSFAVADLCYESARLVEEEGLSIRTAEASLIPLRIAQVFLSRCLESFLTLKVQRIGAPATLDKHAAATLGLLSHVKRRITTREQYLASSGRWEYFQAREE